MSDTTGTSRRRVSPLDTDDNGGLPDDTALAVFALGAPRSRTQRPDEPAAPVQAPAPVRPASPEPPVHSAALESRQATPLSTLPGPQLGPVPQLPDDDLSDEDRARDGTYNYRQVLIKVADDVARRFRKYQRLEGEHGPEPSNAQVVFDAVEYTELRHREIVANHLSQGPRGRRLGAQVPGRRLTREARSTTPINFRPLLSEHADLVRMQKAAGAPTLTAFLEAVLGEFLPAMPARARTTRS